MLIEGRLKQETWETDGQKRSKVKVVCEKMQMVGGRSGVAAETALRANTANRQPRQQRGKSHRIFPSSQVCGPSLDGACGWQDICFHQFLIQAT